MLFVSDSGWTFSLLLVERFAGVSERRFFMTLGMAVGRGEAGASITDLVAISDMSVGADVSMTGLPSDAK